MINLSKQQKTSLIVSGVMVVVLSAITVFQKSDFGFRDNRDYAKEQEQARLRAVAYKNYLQTIQTDPAASRELFQTILSREDIKQQVEAELKTSEPAVPPAVVDSSLNITKASGQKAVEDYLTAAMGALVSFNRNTADLNKQLFVDAGVTDSLAKEYGSTFKKLEAAPVPKEALETQKALITAYMGYGKLLELSGAYARGEQADPWANVYKQYSIINQSAKTFTASYNQLVGRYQLADKPLKLSGGFARGTGLIPAAQALFGLGDVSITIGDIPRIIMDAVKEGLTASFAQFMAAFLDRIVQKIESNYMVANFLYYSDALVSGQYADDYLNKYVADKLDRQLIKEFIPQFTCNRNNQNLRPIFQAKANGYLGFDPSSVSPNDPNYYQKLASVGNFLASPEGWQLYYQDIADQAQSAAQLAAERELSSPGLKSPRDSLKGGISTSINAIVSGEKASLQAILNLGINNASSFISQFVAQITQTLFTKFIFSGATASTRGPNTVGVLKEQVTCLAAAQLTPIVPVIGTQYQQPLPAPDADNLLDQECSKLPRGCDLGNPAPTTKP